MASRITSKFSSVLATRISDEQSRATIPSIPDRWQLIHTSAPRLVLGGWPDVKVQVDGAFYQHGQFHRSRADAPNVVYPRVQQLRSPEHALDQGLLVVALHVLRMQSSNGLSDTQIGSSFLSNATEILTSRRSLEEFMVPLMGSTIQGSHLHHGGIVILFLDE